MAEDMLPDIDKEELLRMTTDVVASYLSHNSMPADNVPDLIRSVHATMKEVSESEAKPEPKTKPAVALSKSVADDYIVCLEDGKKLKMLKRYLRSQYNMSPDDYRRNGTCHRTIRWSLRPIRASGRNSPRILAWDAARRTADASSA